MMNSVPLTDPETPPAPAPRPDAAEAVAEALEQLATAAPDYQRPVRTALLAQHGVRAAQAVIAAHLIETNYGPLLTEALGHSTAVEVLAHLRAAVAKTIESPDEEPSSVLVTAPGSETHTPVAT